MPYRKPLLTVSKSLQIVKPCLRSPLAASYMRALDRPAHGAGLHVLIVSTIEPLARAAEAMA